MIWNYDHDDKDIKVSLRAFHETVDVSEMTLEEAKAILEKNAPKKKTTKKKAATKKK